MIASLSFLFCFIIKISCRLSAVVHCAKKVTTGPYAVLNRNGKEWFGSKMKIKVHSFILRSALHVSLTYYLRESVFSLMSRSLRFCIICVVGFVLFFFIILLAVIPLIHNSQTICTVPQGVVEVSFNCSADMEKCLTELYVC